MTIDKAAESDPFAYAHKHKREIVWMSQNTNHIPTSDEIEKAVLEAVRSKEYNLYPYSKGLPELGEALKADLGVKDLGHLVTHGGIEALYIITRALLEKGDEVVATDPSFMPIHNQIRLCEAAPQEIAIYERPWKLTIDKIRESINERTKAILLIDPHNPMGSEYTREEVRAVCDIAKDKDLYIIDDITYRDFAFHNTLATEFAPERTVLVCSFSKNCGMAGMRIGGMLAVPELMKLFERFNINVLSVNILAQRAALRALETKRDWIGRVVKTCRENQEMIRKAVDLIDGCFMPVYPSSTNMFLIDISGAGLDPDALQRTLLYEHGVFVRSGNYVSKRFGKKFIRVSFSVPMEQCARFTRVLGPSIESLKK